MKKSFLNIALIALFILAMSSVNLSAPKYKAKTAVAGIPNGVAQEGVTGGVVTYIITIACSGGGAAGDTYLKSIDLPVGATWSLGSGSFTVTENIVTLDAPDGTVILTITTGTALQGTYFPNLVFQPNATATISYDVAAPVPVEMTTFSGSVDGNAVSLKWATATEINNYGFDIERCLSSSGTNWEKIGFVNGNGNSNSPKEYSYTDKNLKSGSYSYRLKQIDNDGTFDYSNIVELKIGLPTNLDLKQNYPNPFNPSTTISFTLSNPGNVSLKIYNSLGEEVAELVNGFTEAGVYSFNFNPETLASGTYIYQLKTNETSLTKKMLFLK